MRGKSALVALVVGLAASVPAGGATAAGTCSVVTPSELVIQEDYREQTVRLSSNCAAAGRTHALWNVVHEDHAIIGFLEFDANTRDTFPVYNWPGLITVQPVYAWDADDVSIPQNTAYIVAKVASRLTATTTRAGGRLTFDALARYYSTDVAWRSRPRTNVSLMHRAPGASTWTWVKYATTDGAGRVRLSVAPEHGSYRLMVKEADRIWASYSETVVIR